MQKPYFLRDLLHNNLSSSVKVVRAGVLTEVYVTEKFDRQSKTSSVRELNNDRRGDSALRAKRMVRWLSVANAEPQRAYFWTATFADDIVDYDDGLIRWKRFIRKLKKEFPNMSYVAVPEVQPRSGRWHFHAVFANMPTEKEMKQRYGKMVSQSGRQCDAWMFHFTKIWSEANGGGKIHRANIEIARSVAGVCRYLGKYLTKDVGGTVPVGRRNYYAGGRSLCYPQISDDPTLVPQTEPDYQVSYKDALGRSTIFARFIQKT